MIKKLIQLLIFLGLGIFFIWFSVKDLKPDDVEIIKQSAKGVLNAQSLLFIFISIICGITAHYLRALRNILLIDPLGYKVRKTTMFYSVMTCYLANLAIPRLGEVLRCTFLQRYDKVPFQKSFGTVVVERALDFLIFVLLFILIIFLNQGLLSDLVINTQKEFAFNCFFCGEAIYTQKEITLGAWIEAKWMAIWAMKYLLLGAIIGLVIAFIIFKKISKRQSKMIEFIKKIVIGLWQSLISIKDLQHPYWFVFYTIGIWVFYYLGVFLCFDAFDFLQHLGPMPAFIVLVVGAIGFMVAQGGLGAYPLIVAGILALYNIDYAQGLAAGWIGWGAQTLMILVVGVATLVLASFLKVEDRSVSD
jgi:uncharacterized membrane protein YbhN (UPF0104 family)